MDFATIIRNARTSSGLSQTELASKAGVGIATVWRLEREGEGTVEVLTQLCKALDLRFAGLPRNGTFGEKVQALRDRRDWSKEKLAGKIGVSVGSITRLETGNARIATLSAALAILAPNARIARPPAQRRAPGEGARDGWFTPREVLEGVYAVLGEIGLDAAADPSADVQAKSYYYEADDALSKPWSAGTVFCNPPYSEATRFVRKAFTSWKSGESKTILMLLPVRTNVAWFQENVAGYSDVFFLRKTLTFGSSLGPKKHAPFASMFVLYGADASMIDRMLSEFDCVHLPKEAAVGRAGVGRLVPQETGAAARPRIVASR